MTIDEAIEMKKKDNAFNKSIGCDTSYEEQIVEWLEELKAYRSSIFSGDMTQAMLKEVYNKAIDDFVKIAKEHDFKYGKKDITNCVIGFIEFFAEQLKEGASNGTDNQ